MKACLSVRIVLIGTTVGAVCDFHLAFSHLCYLCPFRVAHAIDLDTERLEEERRAYGHAVTVEKERLDNLESALRSSHWSAEASQYDSEDLIARCVFYGHLSDDCMLCVLS